MGQHEIVDAAGVLLFNRGRVNEVTQILVHHFCNEGCEGSLRRSGKEKGKSGGLLDSLFDSLYFSDVSKGQTQLQN